MINIEIKVKWRVEMDSNESKVSEFKLFIKKKVNTLLQSKKSLIITGIIIGGLTLTYVIGGLYFNSHFYWGTIINGMDVGGKSVEDVIVKLEKLSEDYTLVLSERHNQEELLKGNDIGLVYELEDNIEKAKVYQGSWGWPVHILEGETLEISKEIDYDKELLKDQVGNLNCVTNKNARKPENACVKYIEGTYQIVEGDKGNTINHIALYTAIVNAVKEGEATINLDAKGCYEVAQYQKDSVQLKELKDQFNKYLSAEITYDLGDREVVIDKELLSSWLSISPTMNIVLDEQAVADYVVQLAKDYNTLGKERDFTTSTGKEVKVVGGDYGWKINVQDEIGEVIELIKMGKPVKRQPLYTQSALKPGIKDIGSTYVEVNLSKQYIWFYKEGMLITQGDIVTGNLMKEYDTPEGTYTLDYKKANAVLRGPGYASPVKYWMPFNGGIGLHDASWRSTFGGDIYRTNGSHGCVNLPTKVAGEIFNNIEPGVPVVCYFES